MTTTPRLFVSHSHQDDPFCLRLIADLRANLGEEAVWYDTSGGLHGGDQWWDRIVTEITERPYFLVVLSPNASASKWVPQEMAIAFRQYVELGKRLLPVRLADSPRREDWRGIQEFNFIHSDDYTRYAAALTELLYAIGENVTQPVISSSPITTIANAPDRPLSATERLVQEAHLAYGHERWADVLDKTAILVERGAMTPALWRERASATFALGDKNRGLAEIKQALTVGVDDADTLLVYARLIAKAVTGRYARAGDDERAVEMLSRAYALASLDDTATRLAILEEMIAVLATFERWGVGRWDNEYARRVREARRMAPDDTRWALREIRVLLKADQYDESRAAVRALPIGADCASALPDWRSAISSAARGLYFEQNWPTYDALLDAAAHAGVGPAVIARWRLDFPHFVPLATISGYSVPLPGTSGYSGYMRSMAWSYDGARLAVVGSNVKGIWDTASGRPLVTLADGVATTMKRMFAKAVGEYQIPVVFSGVSWSPDGTRITAVKSGGNVQAVAMVWDAYSGRLLLTIQTGSNLAWSPDGTQLTSGGTVWEPSTGRQLATLAGSQGPVAWSSDGERLATATVDGKYVQIWDAKSWSPLSTLSRAGMPMAWSPDGTRLAMRGNDRYSADGEGVGIWEIASGQKLVTLFGQTNYAVDLSWTPDGARLVGAMLGRPAMWDATTGEELRSVPPGGGSKSSEQKQTAVWARDEALVAVVGDSYDGRSEEITIYGRK